MPTLLLGTIAVFLAMRVLPGDPALAILGQQGPGGGRTFDQRSYDDLRASLGMNEPLPVQYVKWLGSMVNGQFGGRTFVGNEPIGKIIALRLPKTAQLALMAFAISVAVGIPLGILSALYSDRWPDHLVRLVTASGMSLPGFWVAMLVLLAGLLLFKWVPPIAYKSLVQDPWENLQIMALPALIIGFNAGAFQCRVTRANMLEVLRQDYVRTALGKGLPLKVVITRHALKNALIPSVTLAGLNLTALFGGTVVLESIFGIPGIGTGLIGAVRTRDYPLVQSLSTVLLFITVIGGLLVDLSYAWLDPRVKYR